MKTTALTLVLCFCQIILSLAAPAAPASADQTNSPSQAGSLAAQADEKIRTAASQQDYQDAARLLTNAVNLDPGNLEARKTLGWVYLDKLHQPAKAYPQLSAVVAGHPDDVDAHKLLGQACSQTGRLEQALTQFRQASRLKPNDLWIRANLARSLARLGRYHEADTIYTEILRADPSNADARLGEAELEAWRGHSHQPLQTLQDLIRNDPTDVDALILSGDINRWNWDLADARADYQRAIAVAPDDYLATQGLNAADLQADTSLTLNGYEFKDTADFGRYSVGLDTRVHLTDQAYLLAGVAGWRFTSPGFDELDQADAHLGIEYDWNRWLQTSFEGTAFGYEHHDATPGGHATIKISPLQGSDIYLSASYHDPFVSSISTVEQALRQDSIGVGLDTKLVGGFSLQNSLQLAHTSDENNWWEESPQLSYRLLSRPATFLRVNYDYLSYSKFRTNYWTPSARHVISPILDTSIPLGSRVHLDLDGRLPFVFDVDRLGYQFSGGPTIDFAKWAQFKISYIYAKIPGNIGPNAVPWSGHGGQFSFVFRF